MQKVYIGWVPVRFGDVPIGRRVRAHMYETPLLKVKPKRGGNVMRISGAMERIDDDTRVFMAEAFVKKRGYIYEMDEVKR